MKASVFIKVAIIDQMQQIADLGLWFHLAKLIPPGVELLARVTLRNENDGYLWSEKNAGDFAVYDFIPIRDFYEKYFPKGYTAKSVAYAGSAFFSVKPHIWLTSQPQDAEKHLQFIGEKEHMRAQPHYLHVPQWFADFKTACQTVLSEIETGKIKDIEVLKT